MVPARVSFKLKYKPSQPQLRTRRVGSESTDPLEAQYQDEFHHSLLSVAFRISPEHASSQWPRVVSTSSFDSEMGIPSDER